MKLLKYEFLDAPEGSYNGVLKQLVTQIRNLRNNSTSEDFIKAGPSVRKLEQWLQNVDDSMSNGSHREYIQEIMDELSQEDDIESNFLEEIERSLKTILKSVANIGFSMDDVNFSFENVEAVQWIEYLGYNGDKQKQEIVRSTFQSICYKNGLIFIDKTAE
ncbi:hypothetical protein GCM10007423_49360 [Dyadobacter endophyticus]|uniref:Uncharacterized protein n=1 Tax=Dyadobacter endophyticus TaxID=1749036 RepID=A0ABQ1Z319_9BACT|nr:hypothetical protein [Dyadobacter endophyticus]GGH48283.1 hypothetical protein GCM10007423_49360 [Dyadobacter endophyticus]